MKRAYYRSRTGSYSMYINKYNNFVQLREFGESDLEHSQEQAS